MYIDKFQIRRVRTPKKTAVAEHPASKNLLQNPAFMAIKNAKIAQFDRVKETAIELLTLRSPMADLVIKCEFEKYLVRKGQMSILQFLLSYRTIADVWWQLPVPVRELWDAEPSLLFWRRQYR